MSSISMIESKIRRLQSDINSNEKKRMNAAKDEANSFKKINTANSAISRSKNSTTINSKLKEIERENNKIQKAKQTQATCLEKILKVQAQLNKANSDLIKEQQKVQSKVLQEHQNKIEAFKTSQNIIAESINSEPAENKEYDVFISHSANDKDYVNKLAEKLKKSGVKIWYDSESIGWGASIRTSIDKGLKNSKFGIVIISTSFIEKYWTQYEVDGLLNKEQSSGGRIVFLPIWHNITADEVANYSPSISGKLALNTSYDTIDYIVEKILELLK
ncbi:hypothetical protein CKN86_02160 [Carnobacterium divergens]|uniref:TIR domain-containing protein n=1 Tax=Carnobacterium divergens TaxID=2748 RepID=UPI000D400C41|nr:toll/interleukin-1 receptor domain-containing protein [Carnobacterium divergens]MCO6018282.1 toll/interleukin-1 receptor domain-containing protein [Carnobacterium divergens]TFI64855.1 hypothetical protein CKN62_02160 [Carnobacterium divergens]TFI91729.1 hypothetical protein CKN84_02160 [Carnobacterium divergens]TFJ07060.1 hypothetical protein CKN86_02160 [Carnobacterium divergens]TFJ08285.1 hypothetical protein CKN65_02160 [Carnobacterium divergens]